MGEKINPPYPQIGWLKNALDIFGKVRLQKIDSEVIESQNITSKGNGSKIVTFLKFLRVINEEGEIDREKYLAFSYSGDKRKEEISKIVKEAYREVFEAIPDLQGINFEILINFFISEYHSSRRVAESTAKVFLFLCKESGIQVSPELEEMSEIKKRDSNPINKIKTSEKKIKLLKREENLNGDGDIILSLKMDNSTNHFTINSLDDWEDVKDLISKRIKRKYNNQELPVQKEDTSSYDESDKVENE